MLSSVYITYSFSTCLASILASTFVDAILASAGC